MNLQIGDKTFPAVAFQGGTIWVTKNDFGLFEQLIAIAKHQPVFAGDLISKPEKKKLLDLGWIIYYEDEDLKIKGYEKGTGGYCITELGKSQIIAQSPSLNLESIPVVRVEDDEPQKLIWDNILHNSKYNLGYVGGLKGVINQLLKDFSIQPKAAQSKGSYSEAQVIEAINKARIMKYVKTELCSPTSMTCSWPECGCSSKLFVNRNEQILASIQPKIVVDVEEDCWCMKPMRGGCPQCNQKPITFKGDDGRTHFKIKTV
jgi:hypothetical protein